MTVEATSLGLALDDWRRTRWPDSHWRVGARKVMQDIVEALAIMEPALLADKDAVIERIDAAYPFGERRYLPYKMWLLERKLLRAALAGPAAAPSTDEAGVCEVAGDLVQLGRLDEARKLLEQAPNRLGRKCPACGVKPGQPCDTLTDDGDPPARELLVPHLARVGARDHGPLFRRQL